MQTLMKADVFFFIASVSTVILSLMLIVALYYAIKVLKRASDVSQVVRTEVTNVVSDVGHIRKDIKKKAFAATSAMSAANMAKSATDLASFVKEKFAHVDDDEEEKKNS